MEGLTDGTLQHERRRSEVRQAQSDEPALQANRPAGQRLRQRRRHEQARVAGIMWRDLSKIGPDVMIVHRYVATHE
jgi:hypothetical protein